MLAVILCACANNDASQLGSTPSAEAEASEKELDAKLDEIFKGAEVQSNLPEDNGMTQKAFIFENIRGSLVGVYFPDYMDGINMPGWHLHFLSEDRSKGGHVFDVSVQEGIAKVDKITNIFINLPKEAAFDTYSLKQDLQAEIKSIE